MSLKNVREGTCCDYSLKGISQSPSSPALVSGSNFHVFTLAGLLAKRDSRNSLSYLLQKAEGHHDQAGRYQWFSWQVTPPWERVQPLGRDSSLWDHPKPVSVQDVPKGREQVVLGCCCPRKSLKRKQEVVLRRTGKFFTVFFSSAFTAQSCVIPG